MSTQTRILFLDDMRSRWETFFNVVKRDDIIIDWAKTAQEAIGLMKEHSYDQVFLDHDLSLDDIMSDVGQHTREPTGMVVVDWLRDDDQGDWGGMPDEVFVHTCNEPAGMIMESRLREIPLLKVTRIPFPLLISSIVQSS